ncbi:MULTISPECIES: hypothetical protein [unclassified Methanobrevibacter]|uniref:hypothetical protein n=1 Tax=unclassified Methanobrevibacter TaxID=2638681 RepID=UPI0025F84372|nr:hypothetical protein [Methanobrevibacter sp. UBA188]
MIIYEFVIAILIFGALFVAGKLIFKKLKDGKSRVLNPLEYFPEEEVQTLRQVFYLVMMLIFFVFILYIIVVPGNDFMGVAVVQLLVSLYIAFTLDYSSWKNRVLFFLLIPYESIALIAFNESIVLLPIYAIHVLVYAYLIKVYYGKFRHYTETNSLGITIILLFSIIFVSFIVTCFAENVDPLNSLVMVSNAFTSNGYAILGNTGIGKLTAIFLVWGGYTISGVGTATLTVAILSRHYKKRENELNKRLDELESLIKNNK